MSIDVLEDPVEERLFYRSNNEPNFMVQLCNTSR